MPQQIPSLEEFLVADSSGDSAVPSIEDIARWPEPLEWQDSYMLLLYGLVQGNQVKLNESEATRKLVKAFISAKISIKEESPFFVKQLAKTIHLLSMSFPILTDDLARDGNLEKLLSFYETAIQQLDNAIQQDNTIQYENESVVNWAHLNRYAADVARALYFREPEQPDMWKRLKRAKQWYDYEHKTDSIKNRVGQSDRDPLYYAFSYRSRAIAAYCIHIELSKKRHSPPTKEWQQQILNRKDEWYSIFEGCMAEALRLGKVASAIPTRIKVASAFLKKTHSFETTYDLNIVSHKL